MAVYCSGGARKSKEREICIPLCFLTVREQMWNLERCDGSMMDLESKEDMETQPLNRAPCRVKPRSLLFGLVLDDPTHNRGLRMLQELARTCARAFPSPNTHTPFLSTFSKHSIETLHGLHPFMALSNASFLKLPLWFSSADSGWCVQFHPIFLLEFLSKYI